MARFFYQVIKDGQIIGTRSSDREYTHAVVLWNTTRFDGAAWHSATDPKKDPKDFYVSAEKHVGGIEYCGRLALAKKKAKGSHFEIIELTVTDKGPKK